MSIEKRYMAIPDALRRLDDVELVPVIVNWCSGGSNYDYISIGLVAGAWFADFLRGGSKRALLWDPQTVVKYNRESGSLTGLAKNGPVEGGYGFEVTPAAPAVVGEVLTAMPMTPDAYAKVLGWKTVDQTSG